MASDEPTMEQMATDATVPASAEKLAKLSVDELRASASNPSLTEDAALRLLQHNDLPAEVLERIGKNKAIARSRKAKLALVEHPRTPRHISVPMLRSLFTFDLMRVALAPVVPADVKIAAEETLIHRLETISSGEKLPSHVAPPVAFRHSCCSIMKPGWFRPLWKIPDSPKQRSSGF